MSNLDTVIKAIESKGLKVSKHESGYLSPCPDRPDNHPSLFFGEDDAGGVWFKDKAGKSNTESILTALNLGREILRGENGHTPRNGHNGHGPKPNKPAPSPKPAAPPLDWSNPDAIYEYPNEQGQPHYRILRKNFVRSDSTRDKEFRQQHWAGDSWEWGRGKTRPVPYRLSELTAADSDTWVCLCEGEKDADNLAGYGMVTTALAGGAANTKDLATLLPYATRRKWAIFQHNDTPGEKWATEAAQLLATVASEVKVITPAIGGWKDFEHQDPSDYIAWATKEGFDIPKAFQIMIDRAPAWQPSTEGETTGDNTNPQPTFKRLTLAELVKRPSKSWLIENLIGQQDIAMIFGDAGTGKTFATVDLIFSVILGREFAGKFRIERPLNVAYTASEGIGGLPQRFAAAANRYQADLNQANFNSFLDVPQLFDEKALTSVYTFVNDWRDFYNTPLDLLIIDTLHGATWGADENQSKDAGLILRAMKYAKDTLGCAVLLIHHANRQGTYRGSSALHGAMDTMFQTKTVTESVFTLECFKQKDAERFRPLFFRLAPEHYSQSVYVEWLEKETIILNDDPKPPKTTLAKQDIIELLERKPGLNQSDIVEALPDYERKTVIKALDELEASEVIVSKKGPRNSKLYELSSSGQLDRTTDNSQK